ncbi:MAG: ABC transporter permease [Actinomycetes bacterium]
MAVIEAAGAELGSSAPHEAELSRGRAWLGRLQLALPGAAIVLILLTCFLGPFAGILPAPTGGDVLESSLPARSPGHLLGTDPNGNDILSRLMYGGRSSLTIAVSVNLLGLVVGGGLGALSAYLGGIFDAAIMRALDVLIAFPSLVLTLAVAQSLGPSMRNTIFALAFFSIPAFARISRAATLRLCTQPFMAAAKLCGTRGWRVLLRHIAPNVLPQLITFGMLGMGIVIIVEGALSFLGLGVPPPAPSWGNMVYEGQQSMAAGPMLVVWPSVALLVTVLAFNLFGERLRSRWSGR